MNYKGDFARPRLNGRVKITRKGARRRIGDSASKTKVGKYTSYHSLKKVLNQQSNTGRVLKRRKNVINPTKVSKIRGNVQPTGSKTSQNVDRRKLVVQLPPTQTGQEAPVDTPSQQSTPIGLPGGFNYVEYLPKKGVVVDHREQQHTYFANQCRCSVCNIKPRVLPNPVTIDLTEEEIRPQRTPDTTRGPVATNEDIPYCNIGHRIIISNLQPTVSQLDIKELFEDIGQLYTARLLQHGMAEVIYKSIDHACKAIRTYNDMNLDGQPMKCSMVTRRPMSSQERLHLQARLVHNSRSRNAGSLVAQPNMQPNVNKGHLSPEKFQTIIPQTNVGQKQH